MDDLVLFHMHMLSCVLLSLYRYGEAKGLGERVNATRIHISKLQVFSYDRSLSKMSKLGVNGFNKRFFLCLYADKLKSQIEKYRIARGIQALTDVLSTVESDKKEESLMKELESEKAKYVL